MELLIAISLLAICALAVTNLDIFSRYQVMTADRRITIQNELSYALAHMQRQISRAIGNTILNLNSIIDTSSILGNPGIKAYIDAGAWNNSIQDYSPGDGIRGSGNDHWIAYRFTGNTGNPATHYQLWYYHNCVLPNCGGGSSSYEVIARNITSLVVSNLGNNNYIDVELTGRWDATQPTSVDNPEITMRTRIYLPAVSNH